MGPVVGNFAIARGTLVNTGGRDTALARRASLANACAMTALINRTAEKTAIAHLGVHTRQPLYGRSRAELEAALGEIGVPEAQRPMRRRQIWNWLYIRGATEFDAMTDISRDLRAALAAQHTIARPDIVSEQISSDGTRKWLLRLGGKGAPEIETVFIPEESRGTLCLSSQVGCTLTCSFCHTGTQRLVRNLTADEIVAQILVARDRLGDWRAQARSPEPRVVTNIVMMAWASRSTISIQSRRPCRLPLTATGSPSPSGGSPCRRPASCQ